MTIELTYEMITAYLGEPSHSDARRPKWQCPICQDGGKDNLIYDKNKKTIGCYGDRSHSKEIYKQILEYHELDYKSLWEKNKEETKEHKPKHTPENIDFIKKKPKLDDNIANDFKDKLKLWNNNLLSSHNYMEDILTHRGIKKETISSCFIGFDLEKRLFAIPTFRYATDGTQDVVGFEFRKHNFKPFSNGSKLFRAKGGQSGLAQINRYENQPILVMLEGYMDSYLFFQYMTEIGKIKDYHIVTPSSGAGMAFECLNDNVDNFHKYKAVKLFLDNDEAGNKAAKEILYHFPFIQKIELKCNCKDFNEHYLRCIKPRLNEIKDKINKAETKNTAKSSKIPHYENLGEALFETPKPKTQGLRQYKIIPETRTLVIDSKEFHIESWFNLKNALQGDFKTLDYIFNSLGFNINDFEIQVLE